MHKNHTTFKASMYLLSAKISFTSVMKKTPSTECIPNIYLAISIDPSIIISWESNLYRTLYACTISKIFLSSSSRGITKSLTALLVINSCWYSNVFRGKSMLNHCVELYLNKPYDLQAISCRPFIPNPPLPSNIDTSLVGGRTSLVHYYPVLSSSFIQSDLSTGGICLNYVAAQPSSRWPRLLGLPSINMRTHTKRCKHMQFWNSVILNHIPISWPQKEQSKHNHHTKVELWFWILCSWYRT